MVDGPENQWTKRLCINVIGGSCSDYSLTISNQWSQACNVVDFLINKKKI